MPIDSIFWDFQCVAGKESHNNRILSFFLNVQKDDDMSV